MWPAAAHVDRQLLLIPVGAELVGEVDELRDAVLELAVDLPRPRASPFARLFLLLAGEARTGLRFQGKTSAGIWAFLITA